MDQFINDIIFNYENNNSLLRIPLIEIEGFIKFKLKMSVTLRNKYNFDKLCIIKLVITNRNPPPDISLFVLNQ